MCDKCSEKKEINKQDLRKCEDCFKWAYNWLCTISGYRCIKCQEHYDKDINYKKDKYYY